MVYIREAHPTDGWQMESNVKEQVMYAQPTTEAQRATVASACMVGLRLSIPALLDTLDNRADIAFNGWPERLYVLSPRGQIMYQGGKGPYGFAPEELAVFLQSYLPKNNPSV